MTLNCSADGNPPPVVSWTRESDNSAVVFPLTNIGLQHEGAYRCTANNSVGSVVTRDVSIVVGCEYFLQLPSWTLFIYLELLCRTGCLYEYEIGWEGELNYVFTHFAWLSRLRSHESSVPCDEVESQQLFTTNNGVGTILLEICPYLYIVSPPCTFLMLIRP